MAGFLLPAALEDRFPSSNQCPRVVAAATHVRLVVRTLDGSIYMPALSTREAMHVLSLHNQMTPVRLEPTIPGSVGRCLLHWATGPSSLPDQVAIQESFDMTFLSLAPVALACPLP